MARAQQTEVITGPAYPMSILGVPNITFIVMILVFSICYVVIDRFFNLGASSIFISIVPALAIWVFVAKRFAKNPHIENKWRTLLLLRFRRTPKGSNYPGRVLIPTTLNVMKDRGRSV